MAAPLTVDDLLDQVRSLIDEENIESIDDTADILPALNRAQDIAASIYAKEYEEPMMRESPYALTLVSGTDSYDMPEDVFEDRIEKIEIKVDNSSYRECMRISYRDATKYKTPGGGSTSPTPNYYYIQRRKIVFVPTPSGTYNADVYYLEEPEKLVKQQGRITTVDTDNNYIRVNSVGSDLSTESDNLNNYVNIIDAQTGEIKLSLQIQSISGTKITFKSSPDRSSVQNRTIASALTSVAEKDDYICVSSGTCVPYFKKPAYNFYVQYAANELLRKTGQSTGMDKQIVEEFRKDLERTWVGREQTRRVKKNSRYWRENRRFIYTTDS